ncbi:MAG: nucleotide pyrophosphohydrolase [Thermoplasmatota archaeon]
MASMAELSRRVAQFVGERDWEQFHTPKDVAVSLSIETAELLEQFQWRTPEEIEALLQNDDGYREAIRDELADVMLYLVIIARRLDVDLVEAALDKLEKNRERYPPERYRGTAYPD